MKIEELNQKSGFANLIRGSLDLVKRAAMVNRPTEIAIHGADYIDFINKGVTRFEALTDKAKEFVYSLEHNLKIPVTLIGTGPADSEIVDRVLECLLADHSMYHKLEVQSV